MRRSADSDSMTWENRIECEAGHNIATAYVATSVERTGTSAGHRGSYSTVLRSTPRIPHRYTKSRRSTRSGPHSYANGLTVEAGGQPFTQPTILDGLTVVRSSTEPRGTTFNTALTHAN